MNTFSVGEALKCARDTRCLEIGYELMSEVPRLFSGLFGTQKAMVVADRHTYEAAGRAVCEAFQGSRHPALDPFIYHQPDLYAENRFVEMLEAMLEQNSVIPIAVGSGTLNDIVKLAVHRTRRPYMCVATAASMDGYTAFGASITYQGSKQTFTCPAPAAVVADLEVISHAPQPMNAWGYTDLVAKVTAGADWILADAVGAEHIEPQAWSIVQGRLRELIADPSGVHRNQRDALAKLVEGLMLGGFAMQAAQSSRPASGAEHQFSHLWDMQHHTHNGQAPSHGFKVGIGTLSVTALYEWLLQRPVEKLDVDAACQRWMSAEDWISKAQRMLGEGELFQVAKQELAAKQVTRQQVRAQLERARAEWPEITHKLRAQLLPMATLRQMLRTAGAPVEPEEIGITRERLRRSFWKAFFIRRRFTVMDFIVRAGLLDEALIHMFGPHGTWPLNQLARQGDGSGRFC